LSLRAKYRDAVDTRLIIVPRYGRNGFSGLSVQKGVEVFDLSRALGATMLYSYLHELAEEKEGERKLESGGDVHLAPEGAGEIMPVLHEKESVEFPVQIRGFVGKVNGPSSQLS